ncbi:MAG: sulfite exporter TauE/SafE family protein [Planctomycetota bacterium]|nr:sulfite exporter TauE/SafE family protein [Planctomycetota bacterium]
MEFDWALIALVGVVAGTLNTLVGGGTLLVLPLLVSLGIDPLVANGTNRICVAFQAMVAGLTMNRGLKQSRGSQSAQSAAIDWRPLVLVGGAAILGAMVAMEIEHLDKSLFRQVMGWVLLVAVVAFLLPRPEASATDSKTPTPTVKFQMGCLLCGFYGGFIGAGVGALIVLLLTTSMRLPVVEAVRWKVWWVVAMSAASGLLYLSFDVFDLDVAIPLIPSYGLGAYLGGKFALKGGERLLRPIVALLSALLALIFIIQGASVD